MRWTMHDPDSGETWEMPINPNQMSTPHPTKNISTSSGIRYGTDRIRTFMLPPQIVSWTWSGVIRTKDHHDKLLEWARKANEIHVTDHFGRTWALVVEKYKPEDRTPTAAVPWRMKYTMTAMLIRRVS